MQVTLSTRLQPGRLNYNHFNELCYVMQPMKGEIWVKVAINLEFGSLALGNKANPGNYKTGSHE